MTFYLGTHMPHWLRFSEVPLFVSINRIRRLKTWPHAVVPWCLDSGGFTEISTHGRWMTSPEIYIAEAKRARAEIGNLQWCAPQDWMCEPFIIEKTGLSVGEHQRRTVLNFLHLSSELDFVVPVLQGFRPGEYLDHVEAYDKAGVDLGSYSTVGVGSVCRRQAFSEATRIFSALAGLGLRLHGFGVKSQGLRTIWPHVVSADSMAWSYHARYNQPLPGHTHKTCANCYDYALQWRRDVLRPDYRPPAQMELAYGRTR